MPYTHPHYTLGLPEPRLLARLPRWLRRDVQAAADGRRRQPGGKDQHHRAAARGAVLHAAQRCGGTVRQDKRHPLDGRPPPDHRRRERDRPWGRRTPADRQSFLFRPVELLGLATSTTVNPNLAEAALLHLALTDAIRGNIEGGAVARRDAVGLIVGLCRRFPAIVRELAARHHNRPPFVINDEYDVQDLMRALLRGVFDDVRPEEPTPSRGGVASRSDFLLKREQIVVETQDDPAGPGPAAGRRGARHRQRVLPVTPRLSDTGLLRREASFARLGPAFRLPSAC